jgi:hypothetical protein
LSRKFINSYHGTVVELAAGTTWSVVAEGLGKDLKIAMCTFIMNFKDWKLQDEVKVPGRLRQALRGLRYAERALGQDEVSNTIRAGLLQQQADIESKLSKLGAGLNRHGCSSEPEELMTSPQLCHELMLDCTFRVYAHGTLGGASAVMVQDTYSKAFWGSVEQDLCKQVPDHSRLICVLSEVRDAVLKIAEKDELGLQAERQRIEEIIDVPLISQRLQQGCFEIDSSVILLGGIIGVIAKINTHMQLPWIVGCSGACGIQACGGKKTPCKCSITGSNAAQETMDSWTKTREAMEVAYGGGVAEDCARALCGSLENILERLHLVRVDAVNNRLTGLIPVLREHGVELEKRRFAKQVLEQEHGVSNMQKWIMDVVVAESMTEPMISTDNDHERYRGLMYRAMVGLVDSRDDDAFPETMLLDKLRVGALRRRFDSHGRMAVMIATSDEACVCCRLDSSTRVAVHNTVKSIVLQPHLNPLPLVMMELSKILNASQLSTFEITFAKNLKVDSIVLRLMRKSVMKVWFHCVKDYAMPTGATVPKCVQVLTPMVLEVADNFRRFINHNLDVHRTRYNDTIKAAIDSLLVTV